MDYYGTVNRKLTLLISKTIMTYGRNKPIAAEINGKHRKTAQISDTIFSMNPPDLPNAMVIVQELESNSMRAHFANSFSTTQKKHSEPNSGGIGQTHFNHKPRQQNNNYNNQRINNNLRFNQDENQNYNQNKNYSWIQGRFNNNQQNQWNTYRQPQNKPEPMEVDEPIQVQNRANHGYNQSYNKYQNNNYSQNKWDQTKKFKNINDTGATSSYIRRGLY